MKKLLAASLLALVLGAGTAAAAPTASLQGGRTTITISTELIDALSSLGIAASVLGPGDLESGENRASFPIPHGAIDLATGQGQIHHSGGLSLQGSGTQVVLADFVIDTTDESSPVIAGFFIQDGNLVGPVPLFSLTFECDPVVAQYGVLVIRRASLALTQEAVDALNNAFGSNGGNSNGGNSNGGNSNGGNSNGGNSSGGGSNGGNSSGGGSSGGAFTTELNVGEAETSALVARLFDQNGTSGGSFDGNDDSDSTNGGMGGSGNGGSSTNGNGGSGNNGNGGNGNGGNGDSCPVGVVDYGSGNGNGNGNGGDNNGSGEGNGNSGSGNGGQESSGTY